MSPVKIGDQVKFLDQEGGGTVTKILDRNRLLVLIPEGFEIPVGTHEVIQMNPDLKDIDPFHKEFKVEEKKSETIDYKDNQLDFKSFSPKNKFFLAFTPEYSELLNATNFDLYIINPTEYHILYSFGLEETKDNHLGMDFGSIEPFSAEMISTIPMEDISMWRKGFVQLLFHKDEMKEVLLPINTTFKLRNDFFTNKENLTFVIPFQNDALMWEIGSLDQQKTESNSFRDQKIPKNPKTSILDKYRQKDRTIVVDLHIDKISNDHNSLQPLEILKRQVQFINKIIDSAVQHKVKKIIVIHGVGKGILKMEIQNLLKEYEGSEMIDASLNKYGVGASEIRFWHDS